MRSRFLLACSIFPFAAMSVSAEDLSWDRRTRSEELESARTVLREASKLTLKQDREHGYWTDFALRQIADLQIRAGDFDGAFRTARGSRDSNPRESCLTHLAEALALAGNQSRAIEVSGLLDPSWISKERRHDLVQLPLLTGLAARGDFVKALKALEELKSAEARCSGLKLIAMAWWKAGDTKRAGSYFTQAFECARGQKSESDRIKAACEVIEAQRSVGAAASASAGIRRLVDDAERMKSVERQVMALRDCALLAAKLDDKNGSQKLFNRALEKLETVKESESRRYELEKIAEAQAAAGFIHDARKSAETLERSAVDTFGRAGADRVLYAVAAAELRAKDPEAAVKTALSLKVFTQYRDDALADIVAYYLRDGNLKLALATTEKFENPSRKAAAILRVAESHASNGNQKAASEIAADIKLTPRSQLAQLNGVANPFTFRNPESWGVKYDQSDASSNASRSWSTRVAEEVAEASMRLALSLDMVPRLPYESLFDDFNGEEIVKTLARTHAQFGKSKSAIAWARRIGSDAKIPADREDDNYYPALWAVERRINALIGAAEGILNRGK